MGPRCKGRAHPAAGPARPRHRRHPRAARAGGRCRPGLPPFPAPTSCSSSGASPRSGPRRNTAPCAPSSTGCQCPPTSFRATKTGATSCGRPSPSSPGCTSTSMFMQDAAEDGPVCILALDTVVPGHAHDELCAERLARGAAGRSAGPADPPHDAPPAARHRHRAHGRDQRRQRRGPRAPRPAPSRHRADRLRPPSPADPGPLAGHPGQRGARHRASGDARLARRRASRWSRRPFTCTAGSRARAWSCTRPTSATTPARILSCPTRPIPAGSRKQCGGLRVTGSIDSVGSAAL
jgi:hypothetical protein